MVRNLAYCVYPSNVNKNNIIFYDCWRHKEDNAYENTLSSENLISNTEYFHYFCDFDIF